MAEYSWNPSPVHGGGGHKAQSSSSDNMGKFGSSDGKVREVKDQIRDLAEHYGIDTDEVLQEYANSDISLDELKTNIARGYFDDDYESEFSDFEKTEENRKIEDDTFVFDEENKEDLENKEVESEQKDAVKEIDREAMRQIRARYTRSDFDDYEEMAEEMAWDYMDEKGYTVEELGDAKYHEILDKIIDAYMRRSKTRKNDGLQSLRQELGNKLLPNK